MRKDGINIHHLVLRALPSCTAGDAADGTGEGRLAMSSKITMFCVAGLLVSSNLAEAHDIYSRLVDKWAPLVATRQIAGQPVFE
jgi:hypothetical protein